MSAISFIIEARSENVSKKEVRFSIRGGEEKKIRVSGSKQGRVA